MPVSIKRIGAVLLATSLLAMAHEASAQAPAQTPARPAQPAPAKPVKAEKADGKVVELDHRSQVLSVDNYATNGVFHEIDEVLLPPRLAKKYKVTA